MLRRGGRGVEVVRILDTGLLLAAYDPRTDHPFAGEDPPQGGPGVVVLGHAFGRDVTGPGQGLLHGRHLGRDKSPGFAFERRGALSLEQVGQRFEPPFAGDRGPRAAFGAVREIEILERSGLPALLDPAAQFVGQGTLALDRLENGAFAGFEFGEAFELLPDGGHLHLVERAGGLLAVAADEGDGGPFAQQADGPFDPGQGDLQLTGDDLLKGGLRHDWRF